MVFDQEDVVDGFLGISCFRSEFEVGEWWPRGFICLAQFPQISHIASQLRDRHILWGLIEIASDENGDLFVIFCEIIKDHLGLLSSLLNEGRLGLQMGLGKNKLRLRITLALQMCVNKELRCLFLKKNKVLFQARKLISFVENGRRRLSVRFFIKVIQVAQLVHGNSNFVIEWETVDL